MKKLLNSLLVVFLLWGSVGVHAESVSDDNSLDGSTAEVITDNQESEATTQEANSEETTEQSEGEEVFVEETVPEEPASENTVESLDNENLSNEPSFEESTTTETSEINIENSENNSENFQETTENISENVLNDNVDENNGEDIFLFSLENIFTSDDGTVYTIKVSYSGQINIFEDKYLVVSEIIAEDPLYNEYIEQTIETIDIDVSEPHYIKLLDICIVDENNNEIILDEPVNVQIQQLDTEEIFEDTQIVHFGDEPELLDSTVEGDTVNFSTDSFSVYAIIEAPAPVDPEGYVQITNIADLTDRPILLDIMSYYFLNTWHTVSGRKLIKKTAVNNQAGAAEYFFESTATSNNTFLIYTLINDTPNYIVLEKLDDTRGSLSLSTNVNNATEFLVNKITNTNYFEISGVIDGINYYVNMQGGTGGKGFAAYYQQGDVNNRIRAGYIDTIETDPYDLNGKNYGIVRYDSDKFIGAALTTNILGPNKIRAQEIIGKLEYLDEFDELLVAADSEIVLWTFHDVEKDIYTLSAEHQGREYYLGKENGNFVLKLEPDASCHIRVIPGTGTYAGKVLLKFPDGTYLSNVKANASAGMTGTTRIDKDNYIFLAKATGIQDDDFTVSSATKISVSDIANEQNVVIYTRFWNEAASRYDMYIIDKDGSLLRCYDNGDSIVWIGTRYNTLLWKFYEYYYAGTTSPNYYYDMQNIYSGLWLAPQLNGQILSENRIGITMNGRRYNEYYTTILAWDDPYYEYASLLIKDRNLGSGPMGMANDFYFAVVNDTNGQDQLTTVDTVDHTTFGITVKMQNYSYQGYQVSGKYRSKEQTDVVGVNTDSTVLTEAYPGILERNIDPSTGYPMTNATVTNTTAQSLYELFDEAQEVNHLFLLTQYNESGYFEYDSTKNFAHLITQEEDPSKAGNFKVYDQLGTSEFSSKMTLKHGQFLPYNDIYEGDFAVVNPQNISNIMGKELPDNDPRKGERLYRIPAKAPSSAGTPAHPIYTSPGDADYFFGMEVTANFMQSKSGLDDWDHDLIFEFSGDDDFWLYIDGKLVLDLGGVHSALSGDVNFRTGVVHTNGTTTTLKDLFRAAYEEQGLSASEIEAELDAIFKPGTSVFKDYTSHEMKMFYMERGASASNLHMRFNLISVEPGQIFLKKEISGTDKTEYLSTPFAYQIFYRVPGSTTFTQVTTDPNDPINVYYRGTTQPVDSAATYAGYSDVFFLRPKQTASIYLPTEDTEYYIKEIQVDGNIYDQVDVNDKFITGIDQGNDRYDYTSSTEIVSRRKNVTYTNYVSPNALRTLTITKRLFNEDQTIELQSVDNSLDTFDDTGFQLRLFLGDDLDYYRLGEYYVRDPQGNYCIYSAQLQNFVSLGISSFHSLTDAQKEDASFLTSTSGSASKLPAGYSIEIRNLLPGTKFKVEERKGDIPEGYTFIDYQRINGSYLLPDSSAYNIGEIMARTDAEAEVRNRRGWSLNVTKEWSDDSFMTYHAPIYYGVFVNGQLLNGTLRQMNSDQRAFRYWFDDLEPGTTFTDYEIREVELTDPVVDSDGYVTNYSSMNILTAGQTTTIDTIKKGETATIPLDYSVAYETGTSSGVNGNIKTLIIRNMRSDSGIKIIKTDENGSPLAGATFTLIDSLGNYPGAEQFTSDSNGLVTIAYLRDGDYTLTEISSPSPYVGMFAPITIHVVNGEPSIDVVPDGIGTYATLTPAQNSDIAVISILNRRLYIHATKVDADDMPLPGAHFALYREVTSTNPPIKDFEPISGYENLVSQLDGTIPLVDGNLPHGIYYLEETIAPNGYAKVSGNIRIEISPTGYVTMTSTSADITVTGDQTTGYEIKIVNSVVVADLSITKLVTGFGGDKSKRFTITVNLENLNGTPFNGTINYHGTNSGQLTFVNGQALIALGHQEIIILEDLKVGIPYNIVESDYSSDGYTTTYTDCSGTIFKLGSEATITNNLEFAVPTEIRLPLLGGVILLLTGIMYFIIYRRKQSI